MAENVAESGRHLVDEADRVWRANPIPVVLGALATGLLIGVLVRSLEEPKSRTEELKDRFSDGEDYLRELLASVSKSGKKGYKKSAAALKEQLEKAVDAAHDVDVDDYVDPVASWFKKFWKKCCG